jgi:hypothetical protein
MIEISRGKFLEGDLVLVYDNKSLQHLGKLRMHWLGPYEVNIVTDGGVVQLKDLGGTELIRMINGSQLRCIGIVDLLALKKKQQQRNVSNNKGVIVLDSIRHHPTKGEVR